MRDRPTRCHRPGGASLVALLPVALVLAVPACAPTANATIAGTVTRGPMCPVVQEGEDCPDAPTVATVRVVDRATGDEVAVTRAGADGRFAVAVPAGDHVLEVAADGAMTCASVDVGVAPDETAEVVVPCDTGIR